MEMSGCSIATQTWAEYQSGVQERREWRHGLEMAATDAVVRQLLGYDQRMLPVTSVEGAK